MSRLLHQITLNNITQPILAGSNTSEPAKANNTITLTEKSNDPKKWKEEQCQNWFLSNDMKSIYETMTPINGENLFE